MNKKAVLSSFICEDNALSGLRCVMPFYYWRLFPFIKTTPHVHYLLRQRNLELIIKLLYRTEHAKNKPTVNCSMFLIKDIQIGWHEIVTFWSGVKLALNQTVCIRDLKAKKNKKRHEKISHKIPLTSAEHQRVDSRDFVINFSNSTYKFNETNEMVSLFIAVITSMIPSYTLWPIFRPILLYFLLIRWRKIKFY